jgi:hypothetical protein
LLDGFELALGVLGSVVGAVEGAVVVSLPAPLGLSESLPSLESTGVAFEPLGVTCTGPSGFRPTFSRKGKYITQSTRSFKKNATRNAKTQRKRTTRQESYVNLERRGGTHKPLKSSR